MSRYWPLVGFAAVVVLHHVLLAVQIYSLVTKGLLMGTLLVGVLIVGLVTDRAMLRSQRARYAFVLLCAGIALSLAGDLGLAVSLVFGMMWFALALCAYIGLMLGPARGRVLPWWGIPYGLLYSPVIAVLWAHFGPQSSLIAFYGLLLMVMAVASTVVGRIAAVGGLLFMTSEALLGFRMFLPEVLAWFPDPGQDVVISLLYSFGQGLIALGVLVRLADEPRLAAARAERRRVRALDESTG